MNIVIEKDIPAPGYRYRKWATTFAEMKPGDSFLIPDDDDIRRNVLNCGRRKGYRLSTRREQGGIRVWMLERV